jgi:hypothetical protein
VEKRGSHSLSCLQIALPFSMNSCWIDYLTANSTTNASQLQVRFAYQRFSVIALATHLIGCHAVTKSKLPSSALRPPDLRNHADSIFPKWFCHSAIWILDPCIPLICTHVGGVLILGDTFNYSALSSVSIRSALIFSTTDDASALIPNCIK